MALATSPFLFATSAEASCRLPDYCYFDDGTFKGEDENGKPQPGCFDKKVCPQYCDNDETIVDSNHEFKKECLSDSRVKLANDMAKAGQVYAAKKEKEDAEQKRRFAEIQRKDIENGKIEAKKTQALLNDKSKFAWCYCNFNQCLGKKTASCTSVSKCRQTTADIYAQVVGNHEALFVLNSRAFCVDPAQGFLRGD